jgi:hypothetical protein
MKLDLNDPTAVLLATADALTRAGLSVATYGGLALAAYGAPRETKDADLATVSATGDAAAEALRLAGIDALMAFDRIRFGGNRVTRLTLLPGANATGLNTADLVEPLSSRYGRARGRDPGPRRGRPIRQGQDSDGYRSYEVSCGYVISRPRIVPVEEAKWSSSMPRRWRRETKRLGRG